MLQRSVLQRSVLQRSVLQWRAACCNGVAACCSGGQPCCNGPGAAADWWRRMLQRVAAAALGWPDRAGKVYTLQENYKTAIEVYLEVCPAAFVHGPCARPPAPRSCPLARTIAPILAPTLTTNPHPILPPALLPCAIPSQPPSLLQPSILPSLPSTRRWSSGARVLAREPRDLDNDRHAAMATCNPICTAQHSASLHAASAHIIEACQYKVEQCNTPTSNKIIKQ
jgi:hypothetical protein